MIEISKEILTKSTLALGKTQQELKKLSFSPFFLKVLKSSDLNSPESLRDIILKIPLSSLPVIYKISCTNQKQVSDLLNRYRSFHALNRTKTLRVDRINMARFNDTHSTTLYVGSTRSLKETSFRERMNHHLGGGHFRTYGLQLSKWHEDLNYKIQINAINLLTKDKTQLSPQILELVEQTYWETYLPVFGKKSSF